ncbi:MAG: DNA gyrase subunit A [Christensenellales bacterium]
MEENFNIGKNILPINIETEVKKSFISYAMAVIINRALPDVRDGLKPVHRRILYAMHELGLAPEKPFRKCARIVGDVLGKYHPHGDTAVYDALVRLAQDFSMRYPLVQGQGNFGSVDGDSAAAMRYTEAKMSKIALELLSDIDKETVDFYPNFDETLMQPSVLPVKYPNLLVNGSGGIAVGMATNIPPHNLNETINATIALIDNPEIEIEQLIDILPGPDFPTGGTIMGVSGIRDAYMTGHGRVIVRAKCEIEQTSATHSRIIITEIPYQVNKARLVEKIADLVKDKRVEGISDLRDESDKDGMRIVIELKRDVNANVVLNTLYKHTQLQDTFGVNMLALVDNEPKVLNLKQVLYYYIQHCKEVILRRTRYELNRAEARAHILEGLIIALDNIDEVVALIKVSSSAHEARIALMQRFSLSEKQAQAILDMRLQRLTGLEREKIQEEYARLMETIANLKSILASEQMVLDIIKGELIVVRDKFGDERRTDIQPMADEIDLDDLIQEEDMVVTMTHFGYIKRLPTDTYRSQRRGGKGITALSTREEDFVETIINSSTHQYILFFTNYGRIYHIKCYTIPMAGRQAKGTPIVNLLPLQSGEQVTAAFPADTTEGYLTMVTRLGIVKRTSLSQFRNIRKSGLIAITIREGDELMGVRLTSGNDHIILGTLRGKSIRFSEKDVRPMGRNASGVKAIDLEGDDVVVGMDTVIAGGYVLSITEHGMGKRTNESEYRVQTRGGKGVKIMNLNEKTGSLVGLQVVTEEDDLMLISADGTVIRMEVGEISLLSRDTQGVMLMRIDDDMRVVCAEKVSRDEGDSICED